VESLGGRRTPPYRLFWKPCIDPAKPGIQRCIFQKQTANAQDEPSDLAPGCCSLLSYLRGTVTSRYHLQGSSEMSFCFSELPPSTPHIPSVFISVMILKGGPGGRDRALQRFPGQTGLLSRGGTAALLRLAVGNDRPSPGFQPGPATQRLFTAAVFIRL